MRPSFGLAGKTVQLLCNQWLFVSGIPELLCYKKPLLSLIRPIVLPWSFLRVSSRNALKLLAEDILPQRSQQLQTNFKSFTKVINGWWDFLPGFLGLYPLSAPSCISLYRVSMLESQSNVYLLKSMLQKTHQNKVCESLVHLSLFNFLKRFVCIIYRCLFPSKNLT